MLRVYARARARSQLGVSTAGMRHSPRAAAAATVLLVPYNQILSVSWNRREVDPRNQRNCSGSEKCASRFKSESTRDTAAAAAPLHRDGLRRRRWENSAAAAAVSRSVGSSSARCLPPPDSSRGGYKRHANLNRSGRGSGCGGRGKRATLAMARLGKRAVRFSEGALNLLSGM